MWLVSLCRVSSPCGVVPPEQWPLPHPTCPHVTSSAAGWGRRPASGGGGGMSAGSCGQDACMNEGRNDSMKIEHVEVSEELTSIAP